MTAKSTDWRPGPTVCRCCLSDGCYKDISTEYFWMGKREVYAEMLSETLSLTIAYSQSGGPNSNSRLICEACIARLRDASDFRRQVLECEKTFMHHLDPGSSTAALDLEVPLVETLGGGDVKLEVVKLEKQLSDDDDFGDTEFLDDDDDDLDDQPLMNLATKIPKKESVDLMDLLDNAKVTEKRKSSTKTKTSPSKKPKIVKREVKPTPSKAQPKPEKKKKEILVVQQSKFQVARRNAELITLYATAYPFRLPESSIVCVYCGEKYDDGMLFRQHMDDQHKTFMIKYAFAHLHGEDYVKSDCSNIRCRICAVKFEKVEDVARHLIDVHGKKINLKYDFGLQPFIIEKDRIMCGICSCKCINVRTLSRHLHKHFYRCMCELCGKPYATKSSLKCHVATSCPLNTSISKQQKCRRCKKAFLTSEEHVKHLEESAKCRHYACSICYDRFATWRKKKEHMIKVHGELKEYPCIECGETFDTSERCKRHYLIVHSNNYGCPSCDRKFEGKTSLEKHMVVHTKERQFVCEVCSKAFPRKSSLAQHMWIHSEVKKYVCKLCDKPFNQKVSWTTHMKNKHPRGV